MRATATTRSFRFHNSSEIHPGNADSNDVFNVVSKTDAIILLHAAQRAAAAAAVPDGIGGKTAKAQKEGGSERRRRQFFEQIKTLSCPPGK
jgi:hypothetical protein